MKSSKKSWKNLEIRHWQKKSCKVLKFSRFQVKPWKRNCEFEEKLEDPTWGIYIILRLLNISILSETFQFTKFLSLCGKQRLVTVQLRRLAQQTLDVKNDEKILKAMVKLWKNLENRREKRILENVEIDFMKVAQTLIKYLAIIF